MPKNDDNIDTLLDELTPSNSGTRQFPMFAAVATFVSVLPAYVYWQIFDLPAAEYWYVYIGVSAACAVMLALAYQRVHQYTYASTLNASYSTTKKKTKGSSSTGSSKTETAAVEAQAWSLFFNNTVFLLTFMFLAFYVLRAISLPYNYAISVGLSAALVWQLS